MPSYLHVRQRTRVPRRNVTIEGRCTIEHPRHLPDLRCVPLRQIAVERGGVAEHLVKTRHRGRIPVRDALIEIPLFNKQKVHVVDVSDAPRVHRPAVRFLDPLTLVDIGLGVVVTLPRADAALEANIDGISQFLAIIEALVVGPSDEGGGANEGQEHNG